MSCHLAPKSGLLQPKAAGQAKLRESESLQQERKGKSSLHGLGCVHAVVVAVAVVTVCDIIETYPSHRLLLSTTSTSYRLFPISSLLLLLERVGQWDGPPHTHTLRRLKRVFYCPLAFFLFLSCYLDEEEGKTSPSSQFWPWISLFNVPTHSYTRVLLFLDRKREKLLANAFETESGSVESEIDLSFQAEVPPFCLTFYLLFSLFFSLLSF